MHKNEYKKEKFSNGVYFCPYCKSYDIIDFGDCFDCMHCTDNNGMPLEFEKIDCDTIQDRSLILANREKMKIIRITGSK